MGAPPVQAEPAKADTRERCQQRAGQRATQQRRAGCGAGSGRTRIACCTRFKFLDYPGFLYTQVRATQSDRR